LQVLYQALQLDFATATLDMFVAACQQRSVILGLDDAHLMPTLTLKKLCTLAAYAASAGAILHIVLVGHPELDPKLDALTSHHLTPNPVVRYTLSPFTPKECRAYIYHRLAQATTQAETVFTCRALTRIIKAAQGVPGTLNVLCTHALIAGFWVQQRPVSARAAREAIAQVQSPSPYQLTHW
jgi:type II secretory pathway predicted ATPase ExeA